MLETTPPSVVAMDPHELAWKRISPDDFSSPASVVLDAVGLSFSRYLLPGEEIVKEYHAVKRPLPTLSTWVIWFLCCCCGIPGLFIAHILGKAYGHPGVRDVGEGMTTALTSKGRIVRISFTAPLKAPYSFMEGPVIKFSAFRVEDVCWVKRTYTRKPAKCGSPAVEEAHVTLVFKAFPSETLKDAAELADFGGGGAAGKLAKRAFKFGKLAFKAITTGVEAAASAGVVPLVKLGFKLFTLLFKLVRQLCGQWQPETGGRLGALDDLISTRLIVTFTGTDCLSQAAEFESEITARSAPDPVFSASPDPKIGGVSRAAAQKFYDRDSKALLLPENLVPFNEGEVILEAYPHFTKIKIIDWIEAVCSLGEHYFSFIRPALRASGATIITDRRVCVTFAEGAPGSDAKYSMVAYTWLVKGYIGTSVMGAAIPNLCCCIDREPKKFEREMGITTTNGNFCVALPEKYPAEDAKRLFASLSSFSLPGKLGPDVRRAGPMHDVALPPFCTLPGEFAVVSMPTLIKPVSSFDCNPCKPRITTKDLNDMYLYSNVALTSHRVVTVKGYVPLVPGPCKSPPYYQPALGTTMTSLIANPRATYYISSYVHQTTTGVSLFAQEDRPQPQCCSSVDRYPTGPPTVTLRTNWAHNGSSWVDIDIGRHYKYDGTLAYALSLISTINQPGYTGAARVEEVAIEAFPALSRKEE